MYMYYICCLNTGITYSKVSAISYYQDLMICYFNRYRKFISCSYVGAWQRWRDPFRLGQLFKLPGHKCIWSSYGVTVKIGGLQPLASLSATYVWQGPQLTQGLAKWCYKLGGPGPCSPPYSYSSGSLNNVYCQILVDSY